MRIRKSLLALGLVLVCVVVGVPVTKALPSLLAHIHDDGHVHWGSTSGTSRHNHRSSRSFRGVGDGGEPYSAYSCWDNRNYRLDDTGPFDLGHCYIDEGNVANQPTYFFEAAVPAAARDRVRDAFNVWGAIGSDSVNLRTGIAFREVTTAAQADITVRWTNLNDNGFMGACGGLWNFDQRRLEFDSNWDPGHGQWNFSSGTIGLGANDWHFYSVALHEVGHAIGLLHQLDANDLMTPTVGEPANFDCNGDGQTQRRFIRMDVDSREGARDLYSLPVANPVTGWVYCDHYYSSYHSCDAIPEDGVPPFTFRWSNGSTSDNWTGSCYGQSPSVTITDSRGLSATYSGGCYGY